MKRPHVTKFLCVLAVVIAISLLVVFQGMRIMKASQSPCALYASIMDDNTSNAERLITQGLADQPCRGICPIHAAAMKANKRLLQVILNEGVDVNRPDDRGNTAFMLVCASGLFRTREVECFELLLAAGADINTKSTDYENSVLNQIASYSFANARLINELIKHGATIETKNKRGQTPLHTAVEAENINVVEVLLKHGANTSVFDNNNETPLDIAKRMNFPEIQKLLNEQSDIK